MSILCCQNAFKIIQNLLQNFWTWKWPPPLLNDVQKNCRVGDGWDPLSAKYENHFTRRKYGETQQRSALGQVSRIIKWCPLVLVKIEKPSGFLQTELQALVAFTGKSIFHGSPHWSVVTSMNTYQMTHKTSNALHTSNHDFSQSVKVDAKILMIIYQSFDIHMS